MDEELQIKVQAFLDGELSEAEAREIGSLIASDADVAALHKELKHTRQALTGFEKRILVPETREFYWSKIEREIERTEAAQERPAAAETISLFAYFRRLLVPVGAVAALALVAFILLRPGKPAVLAATGGMEVAAVDAGTMTYRNYESGTTLVWLSFPAENGLAQDGDAGSIN